MRRRLINFFGWSGWSKVASLSTALAAVAALYFSTQSLWATRSQYGLSAQGQIADRFAKSIEQLGSQTVDVRLGGIYSLERLARDDRSPDRAVVFEVLAAFVRTHSCEQPSMTPKPSMTPTVDVQAAVTVIGRRTVSRDSREQIDLRSACLHQTDLTGADLSGAYLRDANLTHAWLGGANLTGADLLDANLDGAYLGGGGTETVQPTVGGANLTGADLVGANLTHAWLGGANLSGARLSGANLDGAYLTEIYYDETTVWPEGFVPPPSRPNK